MKVSRIFKKVFQTNRFTMVKINAMNAQMYNGGEANACNEILNGIFSLRINANR